MKKRVVGIVFLFVAVFAGSAPAFGGFQAGPPHGPGGPPPRGHEGRLFDQLGLSDAQQAQIKTIREAGGMLSKPLHDQLRVIHDQLATLTESATLDEAAVRAAATRKAAIDIELAVIGARTQNAVLRVLTPEQRAKLAQLRQNRPPFPPPPGAPFPPMERPGR